MSKRRFGTTDDEEDPLMALVLVGMWPTSTELSKRKRSR